MNKNLIEKAKKFRGYLIFLIGLVFNLIETLYFGAGTLAGFNQRPGSVGELICDYIATAVMILGCFVMILDARKVENTTVINCHECRITGAERE